MGGILLLVVGIAFAAGAAGIRWKGAKGWVVQLFPGGSSGISYVLDSAVEPAVEPDDPAAGESQYHQGAGNVRRARRLTARRSTDAVVMCVLRASGKDFDVDVFLETSPIEPCSVYRRGEPRLPASQPHGPTHETSGFNADVSRKDWGDLAGQIADAKLFLTSHRAELARLRSFPGVDGIEIDFPIPLRIGTNDVVVQCDRFPADLILAAGSLGIDVAFSIWPPARPRSEDGGTVEQAVEPADPAAGRP